MITYFKKFRVKIKSETADFENWQDNYDVLMVDLEKDEMRVLKKDEEDNLNLKPKSSVRELVKPESFADDDDEEVEALPEDYETQQLLEMWVLLGNEKTGELRWFDMSDLIFKEY